MCNYTEPKPLYTSVKTEYLEQLKKESETLACICRGVISTRHLALIAESMKKALDKHPHFAEQMTDGSIKECQEALNKSREDNDLLENYGCEIADEILNEEYLEAMEAHLLGKRKECGKELADTAAVILRMMELNDQLEKEGR